MHLIRIMLIATVKLEGEHNHITCSVNEHSINYGGNAVMSEHKQEGEMKDERWKKRGWKRGREVSRAVLEREGRAWWAPNEQIMTGSILQDGVTPTPHSPTLLSLLHSSSLLFSLWQFNFPLSPPCSCLLIVSEALSLGPPSTLSLRYCSVWERRLECQNVIQDSKQPQRRRSHTIRPDVHLNAQAQAQTTSHWMHRQKE